MFSVSNDEAKAAHKVTLIGSALDATLGGLKIFVGYWGNSSALIADGIHSLSDLLSDVLVLVATHFGRQQADAKHPYGHARFETLATFILGGLLIAVAGALAYQAIKELVTADFNALLPASETLIIAALSIAGKEWIYHYTMRVARAIRSDLLKANAWHSRSDALSSVVVFIGIGGALMGWPWLDQVAALVVAFMVAHIGASLAWNSIEELVDTALPEQDVQKIHKLALSVQEVKNVHGLRTRKMGAAILLDIHLQVDQCISVSEGHHIGVCVARQLRNHFTDIGDITFHIDSEYDQEIPSTANLLPLRTQIIQELTLAWAELLHWQDIARLRLHYLNNKIHLDICLRAQAAKVDPLQLRQALQGKLWFADLTLEYLVEELASSPNKV
ncbi:cation diffusion facilitator family transporter [Allopseudospirillum japonicum]|uniref:Cation diffusion facilitator family transporter n=1 Tax=Allopseudospirillum japonicum TaxID=64971 RepID=A0A1H6Q0Z9_9GAMM|nr:cation diffusion facilitator family transporter [Allopseudospirillum japonicum]SEI37541.1 cation diffusion facilitator family transporter [Allopseudospirillum japonicum]